MATKTPEKLTFAEMAKDSLLIRTALGAVCVPLPDTKSSLGVLQVKKSLERQGIDTTLTLHRVFPGDPEAPRYTPADKMVGIFTPANEEEATIRSHAMATLEADDPEIAISPSAEIYHSHVFRGPSPSGIPESAPSPLLEHVDEIARILTAESAVIVGESEFASQTAA
jgi:hypothetical protein